MPRPPRDRQIDYLEIPATDLERAKAFYGEVFDWSFEDYGPAYTAFSSEGIGGGLRHVDATRSGGPLVVFYANSLMMLQSMIIEAGGLIVKKTFEFPGGRRFHFQDPFGNEFAVWSDQ